MGYVFDPENADATGLVGVGGDLEPATLVAAYRAGVFPWFGANDPILWWSPDPRAVFDININGLRIARRLARTIRGGKFQVTIDRTFGAVIRACAERDGGTWISPAMIAAYDRLHRLGVAHSVEAWQGEQLVGGVYGLALAGFFSGESMFARVADASKVALASLFDHLRVRGFGLFDTQVITSHTASMGAVEIPRRQYLARLKVAIHSKATFV